MVTVSCLARTVAGEFADYYDLMDYTGYDYSYDSDYGFVTSVSDCEVDAKSGKSTLNGTACDLNVSGDDLTVGLKGGITGIYRYQACQNGRPYYKRDDIKGQVRVVSVAAGFCHPRTPSFEPRGARGGQGTAGVVWGCDWEWRAARCGTGSFARSALLAVVAFHAPNPRTRPNAPAPAATHALTAAASGAHRQCRDSPSLTAPPSLQRAPKPSPEDVIQRRGWAHEGLKVWRRDVARPIHWGSTAASASAAPRLTVRCPLDRKAKCRVRGGSGPTGSALR